MSRGGESPERAEKYFRRRILQTCRCFRRLDGLTNIFCGEGHAELIRKGRNYTLEDQRLVIGRERELLGRVLPVHAEAAKEGFDRNFDFAFLSSHSAAGVRHADGAVSSPGLPLPQNRYRHPTMPASNCSADWTLHKKVFGGRRKGVWPSEGSVSEETLAIAHELGVKWDGDRRRRAGRTLG